MRSLAAPGLGAFRCSPVGRPDLMDAWVQYGDGETLAYVERGEAA